MYTRPIYETEADKAKERVVQQHLTAKIDCLFQEAPARDNVDGYMYYPDGSLGAVVEIKVRTNRSTTYDTYMLSAYKWRNGLHLSRTLEVPFLLVVKFVDGIFYTVVKDDYHVSQGGRYDRSDRMDVENCVFIPMSKFRPI